jgi:hypothetical protein
MRSTTRIGVLIGATALAAAACDHGIKASGREDAGRSPNATILPAPLASTPPAELTESQRDASDDVMVGIPADSRGRLILPEAGPVEPSSMVAGKPIDADKVTTREVAGVTLSAEWIWSKLPSPPTGPEVSSGGIEAARKLTRRVWTIEIAESGRVRIIFDAPSFTLTQYTELRARFDLYGHALVWPDGQSYRTVAPGSLRALLDERRVDVTPLMAAKVSAGPRRGPRFGFPTSADVLTTASGKLVLEQAHTMNVATGGAVLCRTLVEIAGADPASEVCQANQVPVHAEYTWPGGATLAFNVNTLQMRSDFPHAMFAVPPAAASMVESGLPPVPSGIFLTREQLGAFRTRAIDASAARTDPEAEGAPGEGFVAVNETDALRFVLIDGVPVAWVPAHGQQYLIGTVRGRYSVQWRSFLGTYVGEPRIIEFPARFVLGAQGDTATPAPSASTP